MKYIKPAALVLLAVILITEAGLRIVYADKLRFRSYPQIYQPDQRIGYRYVPGKEARICVPSIYKDFKINSQGYYGPEFTKKKAQGTLRIAVVGSSQSTGIWMDGASNYSMQLENLFHQNGYDSVEVVNFAIDGRFRGVFNARFIIEEASEYEPDIVLFSCQLPFIHGEVRREQYEDFVMIYDGRHLHTRKICKDYVDYINRQWLLNWSYRMSFIVRAGCRWYMNNRKDRHARFLKAYVQRKVQAPGIRFLPWSVKKSIELLHSARDSVKSKGGRLIMFDFMPNHYHDRLFSKYELDYIQLKVPAIEAWTHADNGHFNEIGHFEIARQLFSELINQPGLETLTR